jgi:hypothetical protein
MGATKRWWGILPAFLGPIAPFSTFFLVLLMPPQQKDKQYGKDTPMRLEVKK